MPSSNTRSTTDLNEQHRVRIRQRAWLTFGAALVILVLVVFAFWVPLQPPDSPDEPSTARETITLDDLDSGPSP